MIIITGLSPELKIRLGNLLIRPVASFGCQIWGVNFNFLDINNNNNNRRLVTLAEHTSDHGKQTNSSTKEKGEHG